MPKASFAPGDYVPLKQKPNTRCSRRPTHMCCGSWRCGQVVLLFRREVTLRDVHGSSRTWHIAPCPSWTRSCTLVDITEGLRCTAEGVAIAQGVPRWCSVTNARRDTTSSAWKLPCWNFPLAHGPAIATKVCVTQNHYFEWGILIIAESYS